MRQTVQASRCVFALGPEEFAAFLKTEIGRWHAIVKKYGIVLDAVMAREGPVSAQTAPEL